MKIEIDFDKYEQFLAEQYEIEDEYWREYLDELVTGI